MPEPIKNNDGDEEEKKVLTVGSDSQEKLNPVSELSENDQIDNSHEGLEDKCEASDNEDKWATPAESEADIEEDQIDLNEADDTVAIASNQVPRQTSDSPLKDMKAANPCTIS